MVPAGKVGDCAPDVKMLVTHHGRIGGQGPVGEFRSESIAVSFSCGIGIQVLSGIIQLLCWRIEGAFFLVVDGDGVKNHLSDEDAVAKLAEPDVELSGIVGQVGVLGVGEREVGLHRVGKPYKVGVGIRVEQSVDDGHILPVGKQVHLRGAGSEKGAKRTKQDR